MARKRTLGASWPWVPSIGQNLQPFTGNNDVSISYSVKNSLVGQKPTNRKTNLIETVAEEFNAGS